ncbi:MAG: hypothetical protein WD928_04935 [Gammaproteobacteria bacterium]
MKVNPDPPLDDYKAAMLARVDAEAEAFRHRFITPGAGQAMVYLVKEAEARALQANPSAVVPHVAAEASARGIPAADVAQLVIDTADNWRGLSAAIEGQRQGAKIAIEAAATIADVRAAADVDWESLVQP